MNKVNRVNKVGKLFYNRHVFYLLTCILLSLLTKISYSQIFFQIIFPFNPLKMSKHAKASNSSTEK